MVGAVPLLGPLLAEYADLVLPNLWQRRIERLLLDLDERLGSVEALNDQMLATAMALGVQSAVTSNDEKIAFLANAIANVAIADESEHDAATILLRLVGDLTATHIRVLALLADPSAFAQKHDVVFDEQQVEGTYRIGATIALAMEKAGCSVANIDLVLNDLNALGLWDMESTLDGSASNLVISAEHVTEAGRQVLRFVTWDG